MRHVCACGHGSASHHLFTGRCDRFKKCGCECFRMKSIIVPVASEVSPEDAGRAVRDTIRKEREKAGYATIHRSKMTSTWFWCWVSSQRDGECWLWIGGKDKDGYGRFTRGALKDVAAHRFAFAEVNGPIPPGKDILHSCDVRRCCNPSHLRPGTAVENTADKMARQRQARGSKIATAKMSEADVPAVSAEYAAGKTVDELAQKRSVSVTTIQRILNGRAWKHVSRDAVVIHNRRGF